MAEEVLIVGIGQTPVEEQWEVSLRELGWLAMRAALEDSGGLRPQALFVGNMLAPPTLPSGALGRFDGRLRRPYGHRGGHHRGW